MSNGLISLGLSGLAAAQAGMTTTSENIANVNTAGYSEESIVQVAAPPQFTGAGYIGTGTQVTSVTRAYNEFQQNELVQAQASSSQLDTQYTQLKQIDNMLGSSTSGLGPAIDSFFSAVQTVAADPSDVPSRQEMLSNAQSLADSFNSMGSQLQQMSTSLNQQVSQSVSTVNSQASQIAQLNSQIVAASGGGTGQQPNTLLDQRDSLIQDLNQELGATTISQSNGAVNVFVGNGQPLVMGNTANTLTTVPASTDPNQLQLAIQIGSSTSLIGSGQLQGGSLTGLLNFRDQSLVPAQNALGQIAINLASAVNTQNELGQDLNGNAGQALFSSGAPQVTAASSNTGSATVAATISDPSALTTSNYRLQYLGGQYVVTNLSTSAQTSYASLPQTIGGVTLSATGSMVNGDSFTIDPTINGATQFAVTATDPSQIAAATPVIAALGENDSGTAAVSSLTVSGPPPVNANLQQPIEVQFQVAGSTTTYSLINSTTQAVLSSGQPYTAGSPISYNGWNLTLSGAPANGDTVSIAANTAGTSDNTNAIELAGLQTANLIGGTTTLSGAYQQLVSSIGSQTQQLESTSTAQDSLLTQAQKTVSSTSGVNLDNEAANLLQYQQAYQAASQTIVTANSMFAAVIGLFSNLP
jgi:flagellar hook-associated protein 1 FlgK